MADVSMGDVGIVTQVLSANPVVAVAVGMVAIAWLISWLNKQLYTGKREIKMDSAADSMIGRLEAEVKGLRERLDNVDKERNDFFKRTVELSGNVEILSKRQQLLEDENKRLRDENAHQAAALARRNNEIQRLETESRDQRMLIDSLTTQVSALNAIKGASVGQRRATDPVNRVPGSTKRRPG